LPLWLQPCFSSPQPPHCNHTAHKTLFAFRIKSSLWDITGYGLCIYLTGLNFPVLLLDRTPCTPLIPCFLANATVLLSHLLEYLLSSPGQFLLNL
jgi:hypothetical protein